MKKSLIAACVGGLLAAGAHAQESPFSYSFVQAGFSSGTTEVVGLKFDTTALSLGGSVALGSHAFLTGSVSDGTAKLGGISINQNVTSVGLGGHFPLGSQTDALGAISYLRGKAAALGYWSIVTGLGFDLGLRHAVTDRLEINGGLGLYVLGSERVQTTGFSVGARYKVAKQVSLGVGYSASSNSAESSSGFGASVRFEF